MALSRTAFVSTGRIGEIPGKRVPLIFIDLSDDEGEPTATSSFFDLVDADTLEGILVILLGQDKAAPRSAWVDKAWAQGMNNALGSFAGKGHRWWSPPYPPIQPHQAPVNEVVLRFLM